MKIWNIMIDFTKHQSSIFWLLYPMALVHIDSYCELNAWWRSMTQGGLSNKLSADSGTHHFGKQNKSDLPTLIHPVGLSWYCSENNYLLSKWPRHSTSEQLISDTCQVTRWVSRSCLQNTDDLHSVLAMNASHTENQRCCRQAAHASPSL